MSILGLFLSEIALHCCYEGGHWTSNFVNRGFGSGFKAMTRWSDSKNYVTENPCQRHLRSRIRLFKQHPKEGQIAERNIWRSQVDLAGVLKEQNSDSLVRSMLRSGFRYNGFWEAPYRNFKGRKRIWLGESPHGAGTYLKPSVLMSH